jgi:predicted PurR-regulated permease PerM
LPPVVDHDRRYVLAGLTLLFALVSAYFLREIVGTVFFAATVAYLLAPVEEWYRRRGLSSWWASTATTVSAIVGLAGLISPLVVLLYVRTDQLRSFVNGIPTQITIDQFGFQTTITIEEIQKPLVDFASQMIVAAASALPTLAIKATVFAIVVFALLIGREDAHRAAKAVVPHHYHDIAEALGSRARATLTAIYVLQAATAAAAFAISLPIFLALGYEFWFSLSVLSGLLQFVPIVGPSVVVLSVAASDLLTGMPQRAAAIAVLGMVFIAYVPDPLVRPRLARRTADLPGSLYFIGFTGGLFTLGVVGVIAGPLLVALLVESVELLADEMSGPREGADGTSPDDGPDDDFPENPPPAEDAPAEDPPVDGDQGASEGSGGPGPAPEGADG